MSQSKSNITTIAVPSDTDILKQKYNQLQKRCAQLQATRDETQRLRQNLNILARVGRRAYLDAVRNLKPAQGEVVRVAFEEFLSLVDDVLEGER